ncbi:type II toxin-antitoxin system RelE/ParE family toxin [Cronobacter dublinensis]
MIIFDNSWMNKGPRWRNTGSRTRQSAIKVGYPLRRFPCASHIIYYSAPDSGIIVLAVLHHSRLPAGELSTRPV